MLSRLLVLLCVAGVAQVAAAAGLGGIRVDDRVFVDEFGRQRLFHGVNAVFKVAPWHPVLTGFDSNNTLSSDDAKLLQSYGFNSVRLGVMWPGLEPTTEGQYDSSYLDSLETIVDTLAAAGIYTLLDLHQDLFHRKFCGEGVPDWVYSKCAKVYTGKPFPSPVVKTGPYPVDSEGNPELSSCLSKSFFDYYLTAEVSAAFQCLYDNQDGLWTSLGNAWSAVAARFKDKPSVLGYEVLNEPWMGDVFKHPSLAIPGNTEKKFLEPLYNHVIAMIRQVDAVKPVFFEGLTIDYWPSGFSAVPGGDANKAVLSYHIYCMPDPSKAEAVLCSGVNDEFFEMRNKDSQRLGVATMMTEFGATSSASKGALHDLDSLARQTDKHQQSWQYWQYKYYADLTTCTPSGESLFNNDGTPATEKLDVLTRPYPSAIAGTLQSYEFGKTQQQFVLKYGLLQGEALPASGPEAATTVVRLHSAMHFPRGLSVTVTGTGASKVAVQCVDGSTLHLLQTQPDAAAASSVEVTLSANCGGVGGDKCTC